MPIETWKTVEAQESGKGGRAIQSSHGEGRSLQHALKGEPLAKAGPANQRGENHAPAGLYNGNAPYKSSDRPKDRAKHCKGHNDTCMGWATSTGYCRPHSLKLAENPWAAETPQAAE